MLHAKDANVRQQAAAFTATLAQRKGSSGQAGIAAAVVKALAFDPAAKAVPWMGGPLYVPNIGWEKKMGTALVSSLMAWYVWCDRQGLQAERTQAHNSLNSVGLMQVVGYKTAGWNDPGAEAWLRTWAAAGGDVRRILQEQGALDDPRYQNALTSTKLEEQR